MKEAQKFLKARLELDIEKTEDLIELMRSEKLITFSVDAAGNKTLTNEEQIAYYERIVANLKAVIANYAD
ncbi:hypothetical protein [Agrobacterium tumefaciens]|uniref:hypothetical protein n=1 Tax=Agrobacterium tumefaciens TaxID=358 RepID=UPI001574E815|nr:hypothetical protein [Agrobacterium tumefaciens]WCJ61873.1 hypothetical protein G6M15_10580 [Agrobacterium tumefaciens]